MFAVAIFCSTDARQLHDGMCSSTCAIASELLKNQGAVRTIAVGGRPQEGPMQGVGGTKGAQVFSWDDIQLRMQATYLYVCSNHLSNLLG